MIPIQHLKDNAKMAETSLEVKPHFCIKKRNTLRILPRLVFTTKLSSLSTAVA